MRGWLDDGSDEVCVAVADVQSEGRGRLDRIWQDRPGGSLLVSVGFRPRGLTAMHGLAPAGHRLDRHARRGHLAVGPHRRPPRAQVAQ